MNKSDISVLQLEVGQMKSNCYLVSNKNLDTIIIDPGDDAEYISRVILDKGLQPKVILLTHGHFDHVLAATEIKIAFNIPILMNKKDDFLLKNARSSSKYFSGTDIILPVETDNDLNDGLFETENLKLDVMSTPGHTPGSMAFYDKDNGIIFVGDLIFADGRVGRYDFKYSDKQLLFDSVQKVLKLSDDTLVYPGHGEPFLVCEFNLWNSDENE